MLSIRHHGRRLNIPFRPPAHPPFHSRSFVQSRICVSLGDKLITQVTVEATIGWPKTAGRLPTIRTQPRLGLVSPLRESTDSHRRMGVNTTVQCSAPLHSLTDSREAQ